MINKTSQILYIDFTAEQKIDVLVLYLSCVGAKNAT